MAAALSTRERVYRTIQGKPVDRVPIGPPVPWSPLHDPRAEWMEHPNYKEVAELCAQHCDAAVRAPGLHFDRAFLSISPQFRETTSERTNGRRVTTHIVHTPKGDLRRVDQTEEGVNTSWNTEPLLKDKLDVERVLSVPYEFEPPDLKPYFDLLERVGDRAHVEVGVSSPVVCASAMMDFTQFLEWVAAEREIVDRLMAAISERIEQRLEYVLKNGVTPIFWVGGSEQATPPMMSPQLYDELVVAYESRLFDMIHHYGGHVHIHCHGRINGVLDKMVAMGADMLDPVEPPPQGDITIAEAKRRAAGRLTLLGNIEFVELEFATPDRIDARVKEAICSVRKDHTFLYPSATAISRVSDRYRDNAIQYIRSGLEYGRM